MSKILTVFGATGNQGSSIINSVLSDPSLSQTYKLRAITRDVNSESAQQLKSKNVKVVHGDILNHASLSTALAGAHTIFAMTTPSFEPNGLETEYNAAKTIADAAVEQGVAYIIFSTLPSVTTISGGKYTHVSHFDAKANAETYIRSLPVKSAFVSLGFFMSNFSELPMFGPQKAGDGTWVMERHNSPKAQIPMIDAVGDTGKFVGAILAEPEKYEGKTFCAAAALYSLEDVAGTISRATGEKVAYRQIPLEQWKNSLPFAKEIFAEAFSYPEEFGYYGEDSESSVKWAVENARGRVSNFEAYLEKHPLKLV